MPDPRPTKQPRLIFGDPVNPSPTIFAFSPSRETLGGTAYLIVENFNILVDCPAWDETSQNFLRDRGGVDWLFITHRDSIGNAKAVQQAFNCAIVIQEQEAYLLPGCNLIPFQHQFDLTPQTRALWTSGHTPGSSCLYHTGFGGVLFTGRHILPTPAAALAPIKTAKTFHWGRQLRSLQTLIDEFSSETLKFICPGANLGFLRGKLTVENAYHHLQQSLIQPQDIQ